MRNLSGKLLVIVDMQNDFVDGCLGTPEAQAIVDPIVAYALSFEGDVIATKDTHFADYLNTQEGMRLPVEHCIKDTDGWDLKGDLYAIDFVNIIEKDTFGSPELGELIASEGYTEVEFCGVCTDICVISNALLVKAFAPEVQVRVLRDLCAGVTPESHENALKAMQACQIDII